MLNWKEGPKGRYCADGDGIYQIRRIGSRYILFVEYTGPKRVLSSINLQTAIDRAEHHMLEHSRGLFEYLLGYWPKDRKYSFGSPTKITIYVTPDDAGNPTREEGETIIIEASDGADIWDRVTRECHARGLLVDSIDDDDSSGKYVIARPRWGR
jgi:hypothetical protein